MSIILDEAKNVVYSRGRVPVGGMMKIECKVCGVKIEKGKRLCAECEAQVVREYENYQGGELMSKIKFRGKVIVPVKKLDEFGITHKNGWVYGAVVPNGGKPYIISQTVVESCEEYFYPEWWWPVEPASVGQFTGIRDKNGREIYEGDICDTHTGWGKGVVIFESGIFKVCGISLCSFAPGIEVIGNVWENPELLQEGAK